MHRAVSALQDLTRRDILYRFYSDPAPRTAADIAKSTGIHRSVAFDHLERLVTLGYLQTERRRGFPGKPAKLYRLAQGPITVSVPPRQFGLLAEQLARSLEEFGAAGTAAARQAGQRLAARLQEEAGPDPDGSLRPLEVLGGEYQREGAMLKAGNCLFREACDAAPIVCQFHAGLLAGLLAGGSRPPAVSALGPEGRAGCRYHVATEPRSRELSAAG